MSGLTGGQALGAAKKYTNDTAEEFGGLKGANCTVGSSSFDSEGNTVVQFLWTNSAGEQRTSDITIKKGAKGEDGAQGSDGADGTSIVSAYYNTNGKLVIVLDDGTELPPVSVPTTTIEVSSKEGNSITREPDGIYSAGGASTAEDVSYTNAAHADVENAQEALDKLFNKVYYVAPSISNFVATPSGGNREIGSKVSSVTFTWTLNKTVASQSLTGCTITATDRSASYETEISSNKTFRLTATDAEGSSNSKDIVFNFYPKVYYGSKALATVDSAYVTSLSNGDLKSSRNGTYGITVASGQYGIIAFPKSYGIPNCKIGGFDTDLTLIDTINVTNASGYTQEYRVYRTPNPSLSTISMVIS